MDMIRKQIVLKIINKNNNMIKKILVFAVIFQFFGCAELQHVVNNLPTTGIPGVLSQTQIGNGLKEALNNGISNQVSKLTATNGFYGNSLVKNFITSRITKSRFRIKKDRIK